VLVGGSVLGGLVGGFEVGGSLGGSVLGGLLLVSVQDVWEVVCVLDWFLGGSVLDGWWVGLY